MSDIEVRLTADLEEALREVAGFRKEYGQMVKAVEKPLRQAKGLHELEGDIGRTAQAAEKARDRVRSLAVELAGAAKPSRELQQSYRQSVAELQRLERQEGIQVARLQQMRAQLQASGVDTRDLVNEQKRLRQELSGALSVGRADAAMTAARNALGVGEIESTQLKLVELRQQYRLVASDSSLSAKQRAEAESAYRKSVSQTLEQLRRLRGALEPGPSKADGQTALAKEAEAAATAARARAGLDAQRKLGVGVIRAEQMELLKLRQAMQLIKADGSLSATQRAEAEATYRRRVSETLGELRRLRAATAKQASQSEREAAAAEARQSRARQGIARVAAEQRQAAVAARRLALEQGRNTFGVTQVRAAQQELTTLRRQFDLLKSSGGLTTRELAMAMQNYKRRVAEAKAELKGLQGGGGSPSVPSGGLRAGALVRGGLAGLAAGVVIGGAAAGARTLEEADEVGRLDARLKLATKSQEEFNNAQVALDGIADDTQGQIGGLITLYSRLQRPLNDAGMQQQDALDVVEATALAMKISGASQADSDAAVRQFAQAMGSGVLRGDEFNSVMEQADRLAGALADSLGVTTGQLREMAAEGKLTSEVIVRGLQKELPKLREEVAQFAPELGAAWNRVFDEAGKAAGRKLKESGITDGVAGWLNDLAKGINSGSNLVKKAEKDLTSTQKAEASEREAVLKGHQGAIDRVRGQILADLKTSITEQQKILEKAGKQYDDAKKRQAAVTAEFRASTKEFSTTTPGTTPSFGAANAAKVSARQKLERGDTQGAIDDARKAVEILRQLREEGANEYGFAGVAKELEVIANKAAQVETDTQNVKIALAEMQIKSLREQADALADIKIGFGLDTSNLEELRAQMLEIAKGLAAQMVIPVKVVAPAEMGAPGVINTEVKLPGFANGTRSAPAGLAWVGERGPELINLQGGERIYTAQQSRALAAQQLDVSRNLPDVPGASPAVLQQGNPLADFGRVEFGLPGGGSAEVMVHKDSMADLLRLERRMRGN
ncbi:tape measure protein [Pseudomonas tohonis]|nr:hypothetical protein L682_27315 [Pseudomonas alcaligenes OT 69]MDN4144936.1 tape measure protein [Pseudomonas tohonis]